MTTTIGAAIEKAKEPHLIERYHDDFATVLPSHMNSDQWVRLTRGVFRTNPALEKILVSNPGSVLKALFDCAQKGLILGDTYHLLPFGNEVTGTPDYTGLIELIYRAGAVSSVKVEIVYSKDHFVYFPAEMERPDHKPDWFGGDRGKMIGVYAYAVMKDGSTSQVIVMNEAEVMKIKAVSKTASRSDSMWVKWPDRAWKKTAIRQLAKFVPTSTEYITSQIRAVKAADIPTPNAQHIPMPDPSPLADPDFDEPIDGELVEP